MKLISENLHIISKSIKEAVLNRDEKFIKDLLSKQIATNPDWIDLNIGPAKGGFSGTMEWLVNLVNNITEIPISFDSTNIIEIENGLKLLQNTNNCIINSTSADEEKLEKITNLVCEYGCNLIALTMNSEIGIPKEADGRLELAFNINSVTESKGIENEKIYFDPLILPICVDQRQSVEALNTIRMLKESFEPTVNTTIGLSNVSNGCPKELRPLINRVFMVLAMGCGLDSAIVDSFDTELLRINKMIETQIPEKDYDNTYLSIYNMMQNFDDIESIEYDKQNKQQISIYKTAEIILNKKVYTNSYLEIN